MFEICIKKRFADSGFSLDVAFQSNAQRLVLLGPSGAGKSLTLKAIAGLLKPDSGRIQIGNQLLFDQQSGVNLAPQERRLGYLFQDYALFPHLNVSQNIGFALKSGVLNPRRQHQHPVIQLWLERFELTPYALLYPHQLSGGQKQRVALARALAGEPGALLLDEPFAALDPKLRQSLRAALLQLQVQTQLPLLLITHDAEDAAVLGQTVIELEQGRLKSQS
ncbi:sulfate/molybdate ABC transporter ATP-binding protein [Rheinheimera sp. 4Y26]|uniref:sulfate/molybdate ABC transporter ATP-binding protein n=1 Tax=Rheinheimera sp. 4Y26 TaxID=2977811 RepID=UPI0021B13D2B|nr:ATP-binding cassette domain-containing protein [Rheinheimera sp. 4Y26]MCT6697973.1 ATP-binding cassette domain-containing protein [Rheinheimera sp. 4Y26]